MRPRAGAALLALVVLVGATSVTMTARAAEGDPAPGGDAGRVAAGTFPEVSPGTYVAPVQRPVADPFRLPAGRYGPGNRGLEYATVAGDPVRSPASGRIAFAGSVAGRLVVSIEHPDRRRSTLTGLVSTSVRAGQLVARGSPVGLAAPGLHFGLKEGDRYVDPARFLSAGRVRAVLVPVGPPGTGS